MVVERNGSLRTPNYPMNYKNNQDCTWSLTASTGKRFVLEPFEINTDKCGRDCTCDYLVIKSSQTKHTKKYCGVESIAKIESENNHLFLHFHSDETNVRKGFEIKYHLK